MNSHIKKSLFRLSRVAILSIFILAHMYQAGPVSLVRPAYASDDLLGDAWGLLGGAASTISNILSTPTSSVADSVLSSGYSGSADSSPTQEQYSAISPLDAIGQYTNPIMEDITGVKAGSAEAKSWGEGVYQLTGGLINLPMVGLFGKSLNDTSSTGTMSLLERGQYVLDHPLEAVEYVAGVATGASLINGLIAGTVTTALTGSLGVASEAITEANGLAKVSAVARVVTDPLLSASKAVLTYGGLTGVAACAANAITGNYQLGQDASGKPIIVDSNGKPQTVDAVSATAYGMGATVLHAATGDPKAAAFAQAMNSQGLSNTLSKTAQDLKTNDDGTTNPAGTVLSIPVKMAKSVVDFAELPLTVVDTVVSAERKGWSEGLAKGGLAEAVIQSDIEGGQAVGGVILGAASFGVDVLYTGPANSVNSAIGSDSKPLPANWAGQAVANAPYIKDLGLGEYVTPVDPTAKTPDLTDTAANILFFLRGNASESEAKSATAGAVSPESATAKGVSTEGVKAEGVSVADANEGIVDPNGAPTSAGQNVKQSPVASGTNVRSITVDNVDMIASAINAYMNKGGVVILDSCSVGASDVEINLKRAFQQKLRSDIIVIAAEYDTYGPPRLVADENGYIKDAKFNYNSLLRNAEKPYTGSIVVSGLEGKRAVIVFPDEKSSDPAGVLDNARLYEHINALTENGYTGSASRAGSVPEAADYIVLSGERDGNMDVLIIGGHGEPTRLALGER